MHDANATIAEERKRLNAFLVSSRGRGNPTTCRACGGSVKLYRRPLTGTNMRILFLIYKEWHAAGGTFENDVWVDTTKIDVAQKSGRDFPLLRFWPLIEAHPKSPQPSPKKSTGFWRPTPLGVEFLHDRARVPKAKYVYNNQLAKGPWDNDEPLTGIRSALGTRWNYAEMMAGTL